MTNNAPVTEVRDGLLRIAIFKNDPKEEGGRPSFPGKASRSYQDSEDQWKETNSYTGTEHLRMARLHLQAYDAEMALRAAAKADNAGSQS